MKKIYYKLKELFLNENFIKFVIIGFINAFIYNLYYLDFLKITNYLLSSILAYIISMTASYLMNSVYNFKTKLSIKNYLLFPLSGIPNIICQTLGLTILVEVINIKQNIAGFLCSIIAIPFSYIIMKVILKKK